MHEGHRQRMLRRLENNEESLEEHELLEIMLFNAVPRKNTNPVAHELIRAFGSLEGVLRASYEQLQTVNGVGAETAAYLRIAGILNGRVKYSEQTFPEGLNPASFEEYLSARYCGYATEVLEIFFFDSRGKVQNCSRFTDFFRNEHERKHRKNQQIICRARTGRHPLGTQSPVGGKPPFGRRR